MMTVGAHGWTLWVLLAIMCSHSAVSEMISLVVELFQEKIWYTFSGSQPGRHGSGGEGSRDGGRARADVAGHVELWGEAASP